MSHIYSKEKNILNAIFSEGELNSVNIALVVDDVEMNRELLAEILEDSYAVIFASDGMEAIEKIRLYHDSLAVILLDVVMPKMGGQEVLEVMQKEGYIDNIPVLIISAESDPVTERACLEKGASDFIRKPFSDMLVKLRTKNAVDRFRYKNALENTVIDQMNELQKNNTTLNNMNEQITEMMGNLVEARSMESGTHVRRVKGFAKILGNALVRYYPGYGLDSNRVSLIGSASSLHDIGKIMIKDSVLQKPGKLTDEEFEYMKTHTTLGCEVLTRSKYLYKEDYYLTAMDICRSHHEKWDGNGYPDKLKGNQIPISAQIVSIADCFDALVTKRVYKDAFTTEKAYEMITTGKCGEFNPDLLDCLDRCIGEFKALVKKVKEEQ